MSPNAPNPCAPGSLCRMRTLPLLVVLAAILSPGCDRTPKTNMSKVPVKLALDDAHNQANGTNAESYAIDACEAITVDPAGYTIPISPKLGVSSPNAIHLIHASDEYFRVAWDGRSPATLTSASLKNVKGHTGFSGFHSGETYILGIGQDDFPEATMHFAVMWAGTITVKPTSQPDGPVNRSQPIRPEKSQAPPAAGSGH